MMTTVTSARPWTGCWVRHMGKGLVPAFEEIFPSDNLYHCTQHLAENVRTRFNAEIEKKCLDACRIFRLQSPWRMRIAVRLVSVSSYLPPTLGATVLCSPSSRTPWQSSPASVILHSSLLLPRTPNGLTRASTELHWLCHMAPKQQNTSAILARSSGRLSPLLWTNFLDMEPKRPRL